MPCNQINDVPDLAMDEEFYLNQQLSPHLRPVDLSNRASDPLAANWSYDGGMDMLALNFIDMEPVQFGLADNTLNAEFKQLFANPFAGSSGISGFCIPMAEDAVSLSSEIDSDDQSWPSAAARPSIDFNSFEAQTSEECNFGQSHSETRIRPLKKRVLTPEIKQEYESTPLSTSHKTRTFSQESHRSSGSNDPKMRNAAKRAAHNIIERRYRTNMNAKFVSLEQAISSSPTQKISKGAGCLKKSEILSNALSYIDDIKQENEALHRELAVLKQSMISAGDWRPVKHPHMGSWANDN